MTDRQFLPKKLLYSNDTLQQTEKHQTTKT